MRDISEEHLLLELVKTLKGRAFEWGKYDCNTVTMMLSDAIFDTDISSYAVGRYNDVKGAIKRASEDDLLDVFESAGFSQVDDNEFWPGDLLIVPEKNWYATHMYINNSDVLCCGLNGKIELVSLKIFSAFQFLHWRKA